MNYTDIDLRGKTILIVEDCEWSFMLLKEILENTGINILHADNGRDALNLCTSNNDINLVLMDIKIPEMDGLEATKRIKAIRKELPVIIQTAVAFADIKSMSKYAGCDGFIEKPVCIDKLFELLTKWL